MDCRVKYLKDTIKTKSLEDLTKQRSLVRNHMQTATIELQRLRAEREKYLANLPELPRWRRVLWDPPSNRVRVLNNMRVDEQALVNELGELQRIESELRHEISSRKSANINKKYLKAVANRNAADEARQLKAQEHEKFRSESFKNLDNQIERTQFFIQSRDYRRGNAIDNYFRNKISDLVIAAFGNRCAFCGDHENLTLDHYGIPKNEGGNFVLISSDKLSFRVNIAVLCRSCNAIKGQMAHAFHFDDAQQAHVKACQSDLLETLLSDKKFLSLLKKWCL